MDQLDKLKNVWQNQSESTIRYTESDINDMVHKKSSSIVKWILIISILEFILPNIIILFSDRTATKEFYDIYDLNNIMIFYSVIYVIIIIGFIYFFYKNYKSISADTSVKNLLQNILNTRKTVKYYIYTNLTLAAIIGIHVFYKVFNSNVFIEKLPNNTNMLFVWVIAIVIFSFVLFLFWCVYRLIFGYFLRKLNKNYKELHKKE